VNCQEITAGNSVDVLEIDGASNTGVDDVREIIENVRYQAAKSRFKIYIIDEVHMLSNSAFNALLKTLEEPPPHVKFIFATTDPHKLPATVQSRCQRYDFRRIALRLVVERLRRVAEAESIAISDRALLLLAREGEGSMRDAQSLLDQVVAGAAGAISDEDVLGALGVADRRVIAELADAVIARDAARVLEPLDEAYRRGCDLRRFTRDLLEHFRNLAVAKVSGGSLLPELADEEVAAVREQAARIAAEDCDRAFRILLETDEEVGRAPYPKLVLEMALLRLAALPPLLPVDDLLERLSDLEERARTSPGVGRSPAPPSRAGAARPVPAAATPSAAPAAAVQPAAAAAPATPRTQAVGETQSWEAFVAYARSERPTLAEHLSKCALTELDDRTLALEAPRGFRADYLSRRDHVTQVEELAARFFGRPMRVRIAAAETAGGPAEPPRPSAAELTNAALQDPRVQTAVNILGGEVTEVRERRPRRRENL
jgi:DNA polymerase-3 subunit gamma/tau